VAKYSLTRIFRKKKMSMELERASGTETTKAKGIKEIFKFKHSFLSFF
jgi:hypothetical protein